MIRTATCVLAVSSLTAVGRADTIPPPGFNTFVMHTALYCGDPVEHIPCGGAVGSLPIAERVHPTWAIAGISTIGGGSASANQLRAFLSANAGFNNLYASVQDTYTVSGPGGPVEIMVHLSGEAHAKRIPLPNGALGGEPAGSMRLTVRVGSAIGADGFSMVNVMFGDFDEMPGGLGALEQDLSASTTFPLTVTANVPFPLAHQLILSGNSEGDALNTAVIDFSAPTGYTITSELGWTPVPEPSAVLLLGLALAGTAASARCRRLRRS